MRTRRLPRRPVHRSIGSAVRQRRHPLDRARPSRPHERVRPAPRRTRGHDSRCVPRDPPGPTRSSSAAPSATYARAPWPPLPRPRPPISCRRETPSWTNSVWRWCVEPRRRRRPSVHGRATTVGDRFVDARWRRTNRADRPTSRAGPPPVEVAGFAATRSPVVRPAPADWRAVSFRRRRSRGRNSPRDGVRGAVPPPRRRRRVFRAEVSHRPLERRSSGGRHRRIGLPSAGSMNSGRP